MISNIYERTLSISPAAVGELIDGLAGPGDRLWPSDRWPALVLDAGLTPGSRGGHGPIRYDVASTQPGRSVTFRFDPSMGLTGTHRLEVAERSGRAVLRHVVEAQVHGLMRLGWPLAVRWLHDALIEDLLDGAEAVSTDRPLRRRPLPYRARLARRAMAIASRRPDPEAEPPLLAHRVAAETAAAGLAGAGALHAAWALGSTWPAHDAATLARIVVGGERFPSAAACAAVAGALGLAAALVHGRVRPRGLIGQRLPFPLVDLGARTVTAVLAVRGGAGIVTSGLGLGSVTPSYRRADLAFYSPLCLALAAGARRATGPWSSADAMAARRSA